MKRRTYDVSLVLNGECFRKVVIDPHYEIKHPDLNNALILRLVRNLHGRELDPVTEKGGFLYFKVIEKWNGKFYRLVLLYPCTGERFLGVVNAFRSQKESNE